MLSRVVEAELVWRTSAMGRHGAVADRFDSGFSEHPQKGNAS
jgi:hypothetical protein